MNQWQPPLLVDPILPEGQHAFEITDPAVAAAVAQCWLARSDKNTVQIRLDHGSCDWCDFPLDVLMVSLNDFWRDDDTHIREREFRGLPKVVQRRLVEEAALS